MFLSSACMRFTGVVRAGPALTPPMYCDAGTYSYQGSCQPCSPGTYQDQNYATRCKKCPAGKYQDQNFATECKDCPVGKTSDEGAGHESECYDCPAGRRPSTSKSVKNRTLTNK